MTGSKDTAEGSGKPGEPTDQYGFAENWGDIPGPNELSETENDYRRRAYEAVAHYTQDYGIPCFPVWWMASENACACKEGISCQSKGKHPIDIAWPEVATADPEQAARWWRPLGTDEKSVDWRPRSNIGILMGDRHFLLDVDMGPDKTGDLSLGALISHYDSEDLPHTLMYQTGGGGRQHVMLIPDGVEVRNSVSELGDNLDTRGRRGYGIAPPSVSGKGEYVKVIDAPPAAPPEWLASWLAEQQEKRTRRIEARPRNDKTRTLPSELSTRSQKYIYGALADAVKRVSEAPGGERNDTLNFQAWSLFSRFGVVGLLDPGDIMAALKDAAHASGIIGQEVPKTLNSAWSGAKDLSGDLDDWIFDEKPETPKRAPTVSSMVYEFERLYDLRRDVTGEFISRPAPGELPPLVSDIGDELVHELRWWWRTQAEAWNEHIREIAAAAEASADDKGDGEEYANPMALDATFSTAISHLRTSATRHKRVVRHTRCFDDPGRRRIVVDLCNDLGEVVEITASGFEVKDLRHVEGQPWFRRNDQMLAQVVPVGVAPEDVLKTLESARKVLGISPEQWRIALGGLIGAYFSSIVRPGWWLTGPGGAGKTTRGKMLIGWVDPADDLGSRIDLRRDPRNARVKAMNVYIFTVDNASSITQDESDFWCTLHTGVSDSVRQLHSDNTMLSYSYRRVGLATSLSLPTGLQSDALRRTLHIDLADAGKNPGTESLWKTYRKIKPRVLGALFSVLAGVLEHLDKALAEELPDAPEMADYARRLWAADQAFPRLGGLYAAYRDHATDILISAGLEDPLVLAIIKILNKPDGNPFEGSPAQLLNALRGQAGIDYGADWLPANVKQIGRKLGPIRQTLLRLNISVTRGQRTSDFEPYIITRTVAGGSSGNDGNDSGNDSGLLPLE